MSRQLANLEIVRLLKEYFQKHPDQRFHQALMNVGLMNRIQRHLGGTNFDYFYADEAHTESDVALRRLTNGLRYLDEQKAKTSEK